MCGGMKAYEETIATRRFRPIAMSVLASGAIAPREAVEYVCGMKKIESIVLRRLEPEEHRRDEGADRRDERGRVARSRQRAEKRASGRRRRPGALLALAAITAADADIAEAEVPHDPDRIDVAQVDHDRRRQRALTRLRSSARNSSHSVITAAASAPSMQA